MPAQMRLAAQQLTAAISNVPVFSESLRTETTSAAVGVAVPVLALAKYSIKVRV
jgi:hypothetical protein